MLLVVYTCGVSVHAVRAAGPVVCVHRLEGGHISADTY